jgi:hypothetical protein
VKPLFLCYDLKGIQTFIFQVPRLRWIIGGSALIDHFDREGTKRFDRDGATRLFTGGGKGAFRCRDQATAERLQRELRECARAIGASIQFGVDQSFGEAAHVAGASYPFLPDPASLEGHPCAESGLYPVANPGDVHPVIQRRTNSGDFEMRRWFENRLSGPLRLAAGLPAGWLFFHDLDPSSAGGEQVMEAYAASAALGGRNRWAVIAMDGNDMGQQFAAASGMKEWPEDTLVSWLQNMGTALDDASQSACIAGMQAVIEKWSEDERAVRQATLANATRVLPLRPLVVGGDDIVVLCHAAYAMDFVRAACAKFAASTAEANRRYEEKTGAGPLWLATAGQVSISAGLLFCSTGLPLSSAIPYAESLLASAKYEGRTRARTGSPAPACVDWEHVTESLVDTPAARRHREMFFIDRDLGDEALVRLTRRPYAVDDLRDLERLRDGYETIPGSVRHAVVQGLRAPFWERRLLLARLDKRHAALVDDLDEGELQNRKAPARSRWKIEGIERSTDVVDALLLLEERSRASSRAAEEDRT